MILPNKQEIENILYQLALGVGAVVLLCSILNGYGLLNIILRTALAFVLMYFLGRGLLTVWQAISPPPKKRLDYSSALDILIGDDSDPLLEENEKNINFPADEEQEQSEDQETAYEDDNSRLFPGQIRNDLKEDLEDGSKARAEIIRKMGWEESR